MQKLDFRRSFAYASSIHGITAPLALSCGNRTVDLLASIDTGAANCLFERGHGEMLGLDIESGDPKRFRTATGSVTAFGHVVVLDALGLRFESLAYFFQDSLIEKNLLGRIGWLDRIRFGLVDHDQMLYVAEYDFDAENGID